MKLTFTEEQIANELHKIYLEEDDLLMEGEFVTGEGKNYIITGVATIEGERYHEFEIEFELTEEPAEETLEAIMQTDWEWYDFLFRRKEKGCGVNGKLSLFYADRLLFRQRVRSGA